MRPPQHWHLHRRRSDRLWWRLVLGAGVLVLGALLLRVAVSGGGSDSPSVSSECADAACAPAELSECAGADCVSTTSALPFGGSVLLPGNDYAVASGLPPPEIIGRAAAVIEGSCGALLYGRSAHQRLPPASLTKIVTALVAMEQTDLAELVDVQVNGALFAATTGATVMGLRPGIRMSVRDLLYGLLLPSGNDAAVAIAEHVGGGRFDFEELMNDKVRALELRNTHFSNPHGLDEPGLYSSAFDMAMLGRELMAQPVLAAIVGTRSYQPAWQGPMVWNSNALIDLYPEAVGVKVGYTGDAGQTIVAAAERNGRRLIVSVLGSSDRYSDAIALFEWAFAETEPACELASTPLP